MAETNSFDAVDLVVRTIAQTAVDNETYFGDLDAVVGDGDFGYSMARGFEQVLAGFDDFDRSDVGTFLKKVAVTITGRIGGTSGPIWGPPSCGRALSAGRRPHRRGRGRHAAGAVEGIMQRGQAELATRPYWTRWSRRPTRWSGSCGAGSGRPRPSRRRPRRPGGGRGDQGHGGQAGPGRLHGERSRGSVDAGATAVAVMLERISAAWAAAESEESSA